MRIIILSDRVPPKNAGGAEKVAWSLALALKEAGHEIHVIATTDGLAYETQQEGIPVYYLYTHYPLRWSAWIGLYNPQTVGHLRRLYAKIQPDVINAHNIHHYLSYTALSVAHRMGIPTVFNSHDVMPVYYAKLTHAKAINPDFCGVKSPEQYRIPRFYNLKQMRFRYNPVRNLVIRHILTQHANVRACVSNALRQVLEVNGLPPFRVVYNGVDPRSFDASPESVEVMRQRLELDGRQVILFGGRITWAKGSDQLLAAMNMLVKKLPDVLLLVLTTAGLDSMGFNKPEFQGLRERHVRLGGWFSGSELAAVYRAADVITIPSICFDSAPLMVLESMAAAKPVVANCYGGAPELLVEGETGYAVNPFDIASLADHLETVLTDPALAQRMGEAGRQRLEEKFTLRASGENMLATYQQAIDMQKASR